MQFGGDILLCKLPNFHPQTLLKGSAHLYSRGMISWVGFGLQSAWRACTEAETRPLNPKPLKCLFRVRIEGPQVEGDDGKDGSLAIDETLNPNPPMNQRLLTVNSR